MARKLMKVPSIKRMISSPRADKLYDFSECSTSCVAEKGHFFVYTSDGKRFMISLAYLTNNIFKELLRISEEEFGLPCDGPITLPCDAAFMEYVLSLLGRGVSKEIEMQLLSSIFVSRQSACSMLAVEQPQQLAVSNLVKVIMLDMVYSFSATLCYFMTVIASLMSSINS
ncbi:auxin-responsive protein SAUR68-like [Dioscorea cayenensis subsp. rotundata]|uniref:Auxin-responsive protein SAUR68-like n=1 Tax=Dioscorea cayennensis subsp. rotundata TaxID=55577 RepID=A0AB40BK44_DIOCR|nr:auxin-responsive protein SAUR68-like [Dioscorea cayenensis subsp. rotundata]